MAHKFDPSHCWKLDNPDRRRIIPPEETLRKLGLRAGDVFVDIGCGIGYFTIPALHIVGPAGKVLGLDTSERMLNELSARATEDELHRLTLISTDEYSLGVKLESVTFAFMANVLHEIDDRERFIGEVRSILVPEGKLAVIDWVKKENDFGPPREHRLEQVYVEQLLLENGFQVTGSWPMGDDFYAIVAMRDSDTSS